MAVLHEVHVPTQVLYTHRLPIWCPKDLLTGMDLKSTPGHGNGIPLRIPFAESEIGNFHQI